MRGRFICAVTLAAALLPSAAAAQTNPLWHEVKTKNYLPHMTWPEVRDLLSRTGRQDPAREQVGGANAAAQMEVGVRDGRVEQDKRAARREAPRTAPLSSAEWA